MHVLAQSGSLGVTAQEGTNDPQGNGGQCYLYMIEVCAFIDPFS